MTQEEFDLTYKSVLDATLIKLAEHPEIDVKKFYNYAYFIENLSFFSPVFFGLIENAKNKKMDEENKL